MICERGNDAQDNGFVFFKYVVEHHPEINITYLIKRESTEFQKVKNVGKVVQFGSLKHFMMCIGYPIKISSHLYGYSPWIQMTTFFRRNKTRDKHIFLQHGITKNYHAGLCAGACKSLSLFICGAKPEFEYIFNEFGYHNSVPQYTGFARYDLLNHFKVKNQILFMPTWRAKLTGLSDEEFTKSSFYKEWVSLLNNEKLMQICNDNDLTIKFYIHYSLQKYSHLFKGNDLIKIVNFGEETVQKLLKESKLLVTDFSSVYFDFAYMHKPLVYFQFDENTFFDEHYAKGYFDYRRDGFGDVCVDKEMALNSIISLISSGFSLEEKYCQRIGNNFKLRDTNNCERIFELIQDLQ